MPRNNRSAANFVHLKRARRGARLSHIVRHSRTKILRALSQSSRNAGGVPRTLATTSWGWHSGGGLSRQHNPSLPAYYAQKATVNGFVSPPVRGGECIQNATKFSSVCQRRAISTRSMPAPAAAGGAAGDGVTFVTTEAAVRRNADPGSVSFVTGANRGIGLEVTRQLLSRTKGERKRASGG